MRLGAMGLVVATSVLVLQVVAPVTAQAAIGTATASGSSFPVEGTNITRGADQLVVYTYDASRTVSPANRWGAEAAVRDGVVLEVRDRQTTTQPATPIPAGGTVLSGHGAARLWVLANVHAGAVVSYPGSGAPSTTGTPTVTIGTATRAVSGTDVPRTTDALVVYTSASGGTSPANQWGAEASVSGGVVTALLDRQSTGASGASIPAGGYVLSGHGSARYWLLANAPVGASVTLSGAGPPPPITPHGSTCFAGQVRLTFDDGPNAVVTPQVLDTLKAWGIKATFFVVGQSVVQSPGLVAREASEGHQVGDHTWDHPYLTTMTPEQQRDELVRTQVAIVNAGAPSPTLWRPPYEDWNAAVRDLASSLGLTMTLWSYETDAWDWKGLSPQAIADRVVGNARAGDIVLMHDRIQNTATALPAVLDGLANKGLCAHP
jgi:peptidoglycan/xylan/chitin deacetylase (PgdA/CDA1 family)